MVVEATCYPDSNDRVLTSWLRIEANHLDLSGLHGHRHDMTVAAARRAHQVYLCLIKISHRLLKITDHLVLTSPHPAGVLQGPV